MFCTKCLICEGKLYFCIPNLHGLGDRFGGEIAIWWWKNTLGLEALEMSCKWETKRIKQEFSWCERKKNTQTVIWMKKKTLI